MPLSAAVAPRESDPNPVTSPGAGAPQPQPPSLSLHQALRDGTRDAHRRVEQVLDIHALASPAASSDETQGPHSRTLALRRVLSTLALFHLHWQPRVLTALPPAFHGWLTGSPRLSWLAQDLAALGDTAALQRLAHAPDPCAALALPDTLSALGSLYVVEGSALGGLAITRMLGTQPALAPALRYFRGHGEGTGARWQQFCTVLTQASGHATGDVDAQFGCWDGAVQAAQATFEALCNAAALQRVAGPGRGG